MEFVCGAVRARYESFICGGNSSFLMLMLPDFSLGYDPLSCLVVVAPIELQKFRVSNFTQRMEYQTTQKPTSKIFY